jgi:hypothetical protein
MITIDIVHEYGEKTEKPQINVRQPLVEENQPLYIHPIYDHALGRHASLIRAAQSARLARVAKQKPEQNMPVDVQRYAERQAVTTTVFERYARRISGLLVRQTK